MGILVKQWRLQQRTIYGGVWTQRDAAEWYGVSERTWRRYERGTAPVHVWRRIRSEPKRSEREIQ